MALALGIYSGDVCGRLILTTATPYHATGLSQSESIACRQAVAESTIMPFGLGGSSSQRETHTNTNPSLLRRCAQDPIRFLCHRSVSNSTVALRLGGNSSLVCGISRAARRWQPTCLLYRRSIPCRGGVVSMRPSWIRKVLVGVALSSVLGAYALAQSAPEEGKRKVKTKVTPSYPELARRMNVAGRVNIEGIITPAGLLNNTRPLRGPPPLAHA